MADFSSDENGKQTDPRYWDSESHFFWIRSVGVIGVKKWLPKIIGHEDVMET
jgi:hypothetical protein